jgi:hypothetical protein
MIFCATGVFDLLKNKGLDKTTSVVLCLISNLFLKLDKLGAKELDKNLNFCAPLNYGAIFCPPHKLSKNNLLSSKYYTKQNLFNILNFVIVVLSCTVIYYFVKYL